MDAFFASVETLDNPDLVGQPVIVGGTGARAVVAACSYEARKFGVRSAMPMRRALRLCPKAIVIRPRIDRYRALSKEVFQYLRAQVSVVEQTSVDEGYLDVSDEARTDDAAVELGRRLKSEIRERFGLACSVGIAPCKFISKIASDLRKPDALVLVRESETIEFLEGLEVDRIPGVGEVGTKKLHSIGVRTVGELRGQSREMLVSMFGKWGAKLFDFARGIDPRPVVEEHERKSYGAEHTFETDLTDPAPVRDAIRHQAERVARRMARDDAQAHTVTLKVRYSDFEIVTRQESFDRPVRSADEIASIAIGLIEKTEANRRPVRLVGVSVSGLGPEPRSGELPLFE
ncbi:DNA polymerase IV [Candidatus Sumerlaeota bacterium]|nr:DNA polymerase IV [Candidatus Sumerlaeota bacterium]